MDVWETLNAVYEPLWKRTVTLNRRLTEEKYAHHWDYFAFHSSLREEEYQMEYFPIPVITVDGVCGIGVQLHGLFIEAHLTGAQALAFDWPAVPWPFEAYDTDDYLGTLYRPGMDPDDLVRRLEQRPGSEIAIEFSLPGDCPAEAVLEIVAACKKWGTHIE